MSTLQLLNTSMSIITEECGEGFAFQQLRLFLYVAANDGIPQKDLAAPLNSSIGAVSRNVKKLSTYLGDDSEGEAKVKGYNLIATYEDPDDYKSQILRLTEKGKRLVQRLESLS